MAETTVKIDRKIRNPELKAMLAERIDLSKATDVDHEKLKELVEKIVGMIVERTTFLVPCEIDIEPTKESDGSLSIPASTNISFVLVSNEDKRYIPIFSDNDEYDKFEKPSNVHSVTMDFQHLANLVRGMKDEGLVLNPFSDSFTISRDMVLQWNEIFVKAQNANVSNVIPLDMADKVYNLNPVPFQLINTLTAAAKGVPTINKMWLRGINLNNEDSYLLVVDFIGDRAKNFSPLGESARKFLGNKPLHIVPCDAGFGGKAVQGITPIYSKD